MGKRGRWYGLLDGFIEVVKIGRKRVVMFSFGYGKLECVSDICREDF